MKDLEEVLATLRVFRETIDMPQYSELHQYADRTLKKACAEMQKDREAEEAAKKKEEAANAKKEGESKDSLKR